MQSRIALMHRALVVTTNPAWPPVSGGDLRNWQISSALAELGPVAVASVVPLASAVASTDANLRIVGLTEKGETRRDAFKRKRTSIDSKIPKTAVARLLDLARELRPNAIVVEGIGLHPLLALLRPHSSSLVLDMHNVESDLAAQLRAVRFPNAQWFARVFDRNPERIREEEARAAALVDRVWVCSRQDQLRLQAAVGAVRSHIVPNGVPRHAELLTSPPPPPRDLGPVVLFVGDLGYEPNVRAVERLFTRIIPLVRSQLPKSRFLVIGRNPAEAVRRMGGEGTFELIENPTDIAKYLALAHVALVPLDIGGGTRLKILEAMAAGVPVVATPLSVDGLGVADGVHVLLARGDDDCAAGVERLWRDLDLWLRLRAAARPFALEHYGPKTISLAVRHGLTGCDIPIKL